MVGGGDNGGGVNAVRSGNGMLPAPTADMDYTDETADDAPISYNPLERLRRTLLRQAIKNREPVTREYRMSMSLSHGETRL